MCLCVWLLDEHKKYALLLASNRDELHARPTTASHFWPDTPSLLAGRDGDFGGTWLGVTRTGRLACLTNYRESSSDPHALTRGELTTDFLQSDERPMEYLQHLADKADHYNGFNLLVADLVNMEMAYYSNRPLGNETKPQRVTPGIHGLSNGLLDSPWPKVVKAKEHLKALLSRHGDSAVPLGEVIESVLKDREQFDEKLLPSTGVSLELEKKLSPAFVEFEAEKGSYGTRSSIVIAVHRSGEVEFLENYLEDGTWKEHKFNFLIDSCA